MAFTRLVLFLFTGFLLTGFFGSALAAWEEEWQRTIEAAKREGKVVAGIPASAELRKGIEGSFGKRFEIRLELFSGRGPDLARRIVDEYRAGVRYFDLHIAGSSTFVFAYLPEKMLDPVEAYFLLPEVQGPKYWWGGHQWIDNAGRYIYQFQAYTFANIWHNAASVKPEEIRSYDDLLDLKWKGKIGILDPRSPGAGEAIWSYLFMIRGEEYLRRLVAQKLFVSANQRQLAEALATGKLLLTLGITEYTFLPFIKLGLPVKPLPTPREGTYGSSGSGSLAIIKNPPRPNAAKVFVNWILSKEGQEIYSKAMGQGSRRLDVDTKWLKEVGVVAAKDFLSPEEFRERALDGEERVKTVREPAQNLARRLLQ